jgi:hypothetical protein
LKAFFDEIESEYGDIRWLSKGKDLQRFLSLSENMEVSIAEKGQPANHFENASWCTILPS